MPETRRPADSVIVALTDALAADTTQPDFARIFVEGCLDVLGTDAAALLLRPGTGGVELAAATGDAAEAVLHAEAAAGAGPSIECYNTCRLVQAQATRDAALWPAWSARMRANGFVFACAVPLQQHDDCIGVLALLSRGARPLSAGTLTLARSLASSATAALTRRETALRQAGVIDQLQGALDSRIQIEQAKGILAERHGISVDEAFQLLRRHPRGRRSALHDVARDVVERRLHLPEDTAG